VWSISAEASTCFIKEFMARHRIAWLPSGGIGGEVIDVPESVSGKMGLKSEYLGGDITMSVLPRETAPVVVPKNPALPEGLFSERTRRIGSENAFRIGSQVRELERIRAAASDVDGSQQFVQEGKHLC
jgi:hypothetical protein